MAVSELDVCLEAFVSSDEESFYELGPGQALHPAISHGTRFADPMVAVKVRLSQRRIWGILKAKPRRSVVLTMLLP